jgi:uncharacterized protein
LEHLTLYVAIGFAAQMVDGALGMAYGVTATSFLLALGISPAVASASVHASEVITTGVSAASHHTFANVDKDLVKGLIIPGVMGAVIGAYILMAIPGESIRPFVAAYLLIVGISILRKGSLASYRRFGHRRGACRPVSSLSVQNRAGTRAHGISWRADCVSER